MLLNVCVWGLGVAVEVFFGVNFGGCVLVDLLRQARVCGMEDDAVFFLCCV